MSRGTRGQQMAQAAKNESAAGGGTSEFSPNQKLLFTEANGNADDWDIDQPPAPAAGRPPMTTSSNRHERNNNGSAAYNLHIRQRQRSTSKVSGAQRMFQQQFMEHPDKNDDDKRNSHSDRDQQQQNQNQQHHHHHQQHHERSDSPSTSVGTGKQQQHHHQQQQQQQTFHVGGQEVPQAGGHQHAETRTSLELKIQNDPTSGLGISDTSALAASSPGREQRHNVNNNSKQQQQQNFDHLAARAEHDVQQRAAGGSRNVGLPPGSFTSEEIVKPKMASLFGEKMQNDHHVNPRNSFGDAGFSSVKQTTTVHYSSNDLPSSSPPNVNYRNPLQDVTGRSSEPQFRSRAADRTHNNNYNNNNYNNNNAVAPLSQTAQRKIPPQVSTKPLFPCTGVPNHGNTCFANSFFTMMATSEIFARTLAVLPNCKKLMYLTDPEAQSTTYINGFNDKNVQIVLMMRKIVMAIRTPSYGGDSRFVHLQQNVVNPKELFGCFRNFFGQGRQHDVHEFIGDLLDNLPFVELVAPKKLRQQCIPANTRATAAAQEPSASSPDARQECAAAGQRRGRDDGENDDDESNHNNNNNAVNNKNTKDPLDMLVSDEQVAHSNDVRRMSEMQRNSGGGDKSGEEEDHHHQAPVSADAAPPSSSSLASPERQTKTTTTTTSEAQYIERKLMRGRSIVTIECPKDNGGCGHIVTQDDDFLALSLPMDVEASPSATGGNNAGKNAAATSVRQLVRKMCNPEAPEGYKCDKCEKTNPKIQRVHFQELPDVLLVHIKRFAWVKVQVYPPVVQSQSSSMITSQFSRSNSGDVQITGYNNNSSQQQQRNNREFNSRNMASQSMDKWIQLQPRNSSHNNNNYNNSYNNNNNNSGLSQGRLQQHDNYNSQQRQQQQCQHQEYRRNNNNNDDDAEVESSPVFNNIDADLHPLAGFDTQTNRGGADRRPQSQNSNSNNGGLYGGGGHGNGGGLKGGASSAGARREVEDDPISAASSFVEEDATTVRDPIETQEENDTLPLFNDSNTAAAEPGHGMPTPPRELNFDDDDDDLYGPRSSQRQHSRQQQYQHWEGDNVPPPSAAEDPNATQELVVQHSQQDDSKCNNNNNNNNAQQAASRELQQQQQQQQNNNNQSLSQRQPSTLIDVDGDDSKQQRQRDSNNRQQQQQQQQSQQQRQEVKPQYTYEVRKCFNVVDLHERDDFQLHLLEEVSEAEANADGKKSAQKQTKKKNKDDDDDDVDDPHLREALRRSRAEAGMPPTPSPVDDDKNTTKNNEDANDDDNKNHASKKKKKKVYRVTYQLKAAIWHSGTTSDSGHYMSIVRRPCVPDDVPPMFGGGELQRPAEWIVFNDDRLRYEATDSNLVRNVLAKNAYILRYEVVKREEVLPREKKYELC